VIGEVVTWIPGLLGIGGAVWGARRLLRQRPAPVVVPPQPAPDPTVVARAAAREVEARQRAEREVVGPPTIEGARASDSRLRDFERDQ